MNKLALYGVAYVSTAIVFCVIDFVWLGVIMKDFYKSRLGSMMLEQPNMLAAGVFYALYVVGIVVFGIKPALDADDWKKCAMLSALFGFLAYATYDLSNLATLKGWSLQLSIIDMVWGAVVTSVAGSAGYFATRAIERTAA